MGPPGLWRKSDLTAETLLKVTVAWGWGYEVLGNELFCVVSVIEHCVDEVGYIWLWVPLLKFLW